MWPAAMLAVKRLAGVAPEVHLRNPLQAGKGAHKQGIHPGYETQSRYHQKSKTGVSVAPQKRTCILQTFFLKSGKINMQSNEFTSTGRFFFSKYDIVSFSEESLERNEIDQYRFLWDWNLSDNDQYDPSVTRELPWCLVHRLEKKPDKYVLFMLKFVYSDSK